VRLESKLVIPLVNGKFPNQGADLIRSLGSEPSWLKVAAESSIEQAMMLAFRGVASARMRCRLSPERWYKRSFKRDQMPTASMASILTSPLGERTCVVDESAEKRLDLLPTWQGSEMDESECRCPHGSGRSTVQVEGFHGAVDVVVHCVA
jgi:hypothetical protein